MVRALTESYGSIARIGIPSALVSLAPQIASGIVTAILSRTFGDEYCGIYTFCLTIFNIFCFSCNFLVNSVTSQVATVFGRGPAGAPDVARLTRLALLAGVIVGVAGALLMIALAPYLAMLASSDLAPELVAATARQFRLLAPAVPLFLVARAATGVLTGLAVATLALAIQIVESLIVVGVCAVWAKTGPSAGLDIGAYSNIIGCGAAASVATVLLFALPNVRKYTLARGQTTAASSLRLFVTGNAYIFVRSFLLQISFFLANTLANRLGKDVSTAYAVVLNTWMVFSALLDGVAAAANAVGASLLGAKKPREFIVLAKRTCVVATVLSALWMIPMIAAPRQIIRIFTHNEDIVHICMESWWWVLAAQPINALVFVMDGLMYSTGDFRAIACVMTVGTLGFFIPAIFTTYKHGLWVIWIEKALLNVIRGVGGSITVTKCVKKQFKAARGLLEEPQEYSEKTDETHSESYI